jgi:hypothetical protein
MLFVRQSCDINACEYSPIFVFNVTEFLHKFIGRLEGTVRVGRVRGQVRQVEEQRLRSVVLIDDFDGLLCQQSGCVFAPAVLGHVHASSHVISPIVKLQLYLCS